MKCDSTVEQHGMCFERCQWIYYKMLVVTHEDAGKVNLISARSEGSFSSRLHQQPKQREIKC